MQRLVKMLEPGDLCPLCGSPIQTDDPGELLVLSLIAEILGDVSEVGTSPERKEDGHERFV